MFAATLSDMLLATSVAMKTIGGLRRVTTAISEGGVSSPFTLRANFSIASAEPLSRAVSMHSDAASQGGSCWAVARLTTSEIHIWMTKTYENQSPRSVCHGV